MTIFPLFLIVLFVLGICVAGMAIGVMAGRKPIKHCGNSSFTFKGQQVDCPVCANKACPNQQKGVCVKK